MTPKGKITSKKHVARLERERRQVKLIQYIAAGVITAVVLIIAYGYLDSNVLKAREPVAVVNEEEISTGEFQARVKLHRQELLDQYLQYLQFQQQFDLDFSAQLEQIQTAFDNPKMVGKQALDILIDEALIRQEAEQLGVSVSDDELESFIREQFQFFPDGTPTATITPTEVTIEYPTMSASQLDLITATPSPTKGPTSTPFPTATNDLNNDNNTTPTPSFTPAPIPTATKYTLEGYETRVAGVLSDMEELGLTEDQYWRYFESALLRSKLIDEITKDLVEEEQVWARQILVGDEATAQEVVERLKNDEDFSELANEYSRDTGSSLQGGDLGWFGPGRMVPDFEAVAFSLDEFEISEPVYTEDFGWHIIQLLGRTAVPLTASTYPQARQTKFDSFLTNTREKADIVKYDYWGERVPESPSLQEILTSQFIQ